MALEKELPGLSSGSGVLFSIVARVSSWPGGPSTGAGAAGDRQSPAACDWGWRGNIWWVPRVLGQSPGKGGVRPDLEELQQPAGSADGGWEVSGCREQPQSGSCLRVRVLGQLRVWEGRFTSKRR